MESTRLTDAELAEIRRRRPGVRASLACEGMFLSPDQEAFVDQMDRERIGGEDRIRQAIEFERAHRRQAAKAVG